jgi:nicotinate phosphoribosyltransferase
MTNLTPLLTDLYQLTMSAAYWKSGKSEQEAVFHLFFRRLPFTGGYAIAAGLADAVEYLRRFRFNAEEVAYLAKLKGNDGTPLFESGFLDYLRDLRMTCDVDAIPEGSLVFAHEPMMRIRGPVVQAQLFETALLNILNFQTLVATKAARVCHSAKGDPVIEFGLRRAQGPDGAVMASRAAYLGGCAATSNVLAGQRLGIPVKGTHAHSWVMSFDSELESFLAYAKAMPHNCTLLVDTYNTLDGVRHAIEAGKTLRTKGHDLAGIRLDSGDLATLSLEARALLDAAGFQNASIVASNDLDEQLIESLKQQGATINIWGVGTKLVTCYDQPALGGVYKLGAIRGSDGEWDYKVKLSEQVAKISNPGIQQIRRFKVDGKIVGDCIYDTELPREGPWTAVALDDPLKQIRYPDNSGEDVLVPIFRAGKEVAELPPLPAIREHTLSQLASLPDGTKRYLNPHIYPVGLEEGLHQKKLGLIKAARAAATA